MRVACVCWSVSCFCFTLFSLVVVGFVFVFCLLFVVGVRYGCLLLCVMLGVDGSLLFVVVFLHMVIVACSMLLIGCCCGLL